MWRFLSGIESLSANKDLEKATDGVSVDVSDDDSEKEPTPEQLQAERVEKRNLAIEQNKLSIIGTARCLTTAEIPPDIVSHVRFSRKPSVHDFVWDRAGEISDFVFHYKGEGGYDVLVGRNESLGITKLALLVCGESEDSFIDVFPSKDGKMFSFCGYHHYYDVVFPLSFPAIQGKHRYMYSGSGENEILYLDNVL
jgi:hypothetical protein